jgi:hypothetical protein
MNRAATRRWQGMWNVAGEQGDGAAPTGSASER